jgi:hypothetical protein
MIIVRDAVGSALEQPSVLSAPIAVGCKPSVSRQLGEAEGGPIGRPLCSVPFSEMPDEPT